ncbi:MAG TPA: hypothetical protein VKL21_11495, partial [Candidatus Methanoperedens sp.]|nr:hypothetical protein [Candidatus Methanoperedens sp.]
MDGTKLSLIRFSRKKLSGDFIFEAIVGLFALSILILAFFLFRELFIGSGLSRNTFGLSFLVTSTWNPVNEIFGALPFIFGTL